MCVREREKERVCAPARKCKGGECICACACCLSDVISPVLYKQQQHVVSVCSHLAAFVNRETGRG